MEPTPRKVGGANVICFLTVDRRHQPTGNCRQIVAGVVQGPASGLAICQHDGEEGYFLFGCNQDWEVITDTWHQTLDEALAQAEFEYTGASATWQYYA